MLIELADRIWANPKFQSDLTALVSARVRHATLGLMPGSKGNIAEDIGEEAVARLLQAATALAQSPNSDHKEAAYRIATSTQAMFGRSLSGLSSLMYVVLSRLGNFPAIRFSHGGYEPPAVLPLPLVLEAEHRLMGNTVFVRKDTEIVLTDFQRSLWGALEDGASFGASAPTSAGKSYLLQAYIRKLWSRPQRPRVAYIVPTRALINQVSIELLDALREDGAEAAEIVTVPVAADQQILDNSLFVMTQERLQLTLTNHPNAGFDLVIVDEAQAVNDGGRGVLLVAVLEELTRRNERVQMFFASPNIANPEVFGRLFSLKGYHAHKSRDVTVAQNLIFLNTSDVDLRRVKISLREAGRRREIGETLASDDMPNPRLATIHLSHLFGRGAQSLVYAKGPDDCEEIALGLDQLEVKRLEDEAKAAETAGTRAIDHAPSARRNALAVFIKDNVHPQYALGQTVLRGVGFHYSTMPTLLRRAIENAFRDGELGFLVSTSTLLHGLNLPARSLFLNRPHRGNDQPIEAVDFWNLAGRAGRLGKEFEGDVYLINYEDWPSKPLEGERELVVKSTLETHVLDRAGELLAYISDPDSKPDIMGKDPFENTFGKLFFDYRAGRLDETLDRLEVPKSSDLREQLASALKGADSRVGLEDTVVRASPTVSAYRQQRLYDYMLQRIDEKGPEYLMPVHPATKNAQANLLTIFKRCHNEIFQWPTNDQRHKRFSVFAIKWMNGEPLPKIIDSLYAFEKSRNESFTIRQAIRLTLDAIEKDLRFTYVRLTSCYNTLLARALTEKGHGYLVARIAPIPMYLEVGASSKTMISFIGLGLSRISARRLSEKAVHQNMEPAEAKAWARKQDLDVLGLSPIIVDEVRRTLRS